MEKAFYKKPHYLALWVHLLLSANHDESEFMWNGGVLKVKSGQFVTGRKQLSAQSGIPETTVEDILSFLEREQQIRQQKTTKYRLITIVKWGQYQNSDNKATTKRQQADTNKNEKNEKNLLSEANASGTNGKDMGWKNKPSDNDDDLPAIDMDSGEEVKPKEKKKRHYKEVYELFRVLGPVPLNWSVNTTEQKCADNLYTERGVEQIKTALQFYLEHKHLEYIPEITSPYDLDSKWKKLLSFKKKNG